MRQRPLVVADPAPAAQAVPAGALSESRRLNELVEAYFEDYLRPNPVSATSIGDSRYDDRFDPRKFHTAVLGDGPLPLDVLEAKVDRWIASQKGG